MTRMHTEFTQGMINVVWLQDLRWLYTLVSISTHPSLRPLLWQLLSHNLIISTLAGTAALHMAHLQLIQNNLAWVVTQKSCFSHISPVFSYLHWLPIRHRIDLKIITILWHCSFNIPWLAPIQFCFLVWYKLLGHLDPFQLCLQKKTKASTIICF